MTQTLLGCDPKYFINDLNEQLIPFLEYGELDSGTVGPYFAGGYSIQLDMREYEAVPIVEGHGEFMTKDGEEFGYTYKLKSYTPETKTAIYEVDFE